MSYALNIQQANAVLDEIRKDYTVFAPKRFPKQGRYSDTDIIRYAEISRFEDIVWDTKSDYPAKEVLTPIQQAIFYFTEDEYRESKGPEKPYLVLARPCDIAAQHVQQKIYAGNGGYTDVYYERVRKLVRFAMMECNGGDDTCFCVSMGTNRTDDYSLALKFSSEGVKVQVTDDDFIGLWVKVSRMRAIDFYYHHLQHFNSDNYDLLLELRGRNDKPYEFYWFKLRPGQKRQTYLRMYFEGNSPTEIAKECGSRLSTVSSEVTRSVQFMQKYFKRDIEQWYK